MTRHLRKACGAWLAALVLSSCGGGATPQLDSSGPPVIESLAPDSILAGSPSFTLTVVGANFDVRSVVNLSGNSASQALPTIFVNATTLTVTVPAAAIVGAANYQVTVDNGSQVSAPSVFPVVAQHDFIVSATPGSITIRPGNTATVSVAVRPLAGFAGTVDLSIAGLPAGVTASFSPASIAVSGSTTVTLTVATTAAPTGTPVALRVDGSAGALVRSAAIVLDVASPVGVGIVNVISRSDSGILANDVSDDISLSNNGRFAAFSSKANNLVAPANRHAPEIFVHDDCVGAAGCSATTRLASAVTATTAEGDNSSQGPTAISADGRFVAFVSDAHNLGAGAAAQFQQAYVRDTCTGAPAGCVPATTMVSLTSAGSEPSGDSDGVAMSRDGRYFAFRSIGKDVVPGITVPFAQSQIYLRDTCRTTSGAVAACTPATLLVSVNSDGNPGEASSERWLSVSANGRFVAFASQASNLPGGSSHRTPQDYVRDTCINVAGCRPSTIIVSVDTAGNPAPSGDLNQHPAMSADGRFVAFASRSPLAPASSSSVGNIFLRDTCGGEAGTVVGCTPSTVTVSVALDGLAADGDSAVSPRSISADGRYVLFVSLATNLGDVVRAQFGVYVRDTCAGVVADCTPFTRLISVDRGGAFVPARFDGAAISADGRYGAFVVFALSGPNSDQAVLALTGF